jgi:hypothetical protein
MVINKSTTNNVVPILKLVYFLKIIANISVPPPDAPILNKMAALIAGKVTANINSNTGSSVIGPAIGINFSKKLSPTEVSKLTYMVLVPNFLPKKTNPNTIRIILIINV